MCWLFFVHLALTSAVLGSPYHNVPLRHSSRFGLFSGRIIGGDDADIKDFPYQVSMEYYGQHMCGGSIISETFVITAGHCTFGINADEIAIRANTSTLGAGGTRVNVKDIHHNPNYGPYGADYDISILELMDPLKFGEGVHQVGLPKSLSVLSEGTSVVVTGWGVLKEGDSTLSERLQAVKVNIVSQKICRKDYHGELISDRMICAGVTKGGKDACQGDSGGPLVSDGILYGIVSWGYGCAEKAFPGVYSNVAALREFVADVTGF